MARLEFGLGKSAQLLGFDGERSAPAGVGPELMEGQVSTRRIRGAFIVHDWDKGLMVSLELWSRVCDEVVVVVNGHTADASAAISQSFSTGRVTLEQGQGNVGYGTAANLAFSAGRRLPDYDIFLILNSDTFPKDAEELRDALMYTTFDIASMPLENVDGSPQRSYAPFPRTSALLRSVFLKEVGVLGDLGVDCYPVGAAIAARAGAFRSVGGFDPDFFMYYEEVDLCRRFATCAFEWRRIDSPVVHTGAASTSRHQAALDFELGWSAVTYARKHPEAGRWWLPALVAVLFAGGLKHGKIQFRRNLTSARGIVARLLARSDSPTSPYYASLAVVQPAFRRSLGRVS